MRPDRMARVPLRWLRRILAQPTLLPFLYETTTILQHPPAKWSRQYSESLQRPPNQDTESKRNVRAPRAEGTGPPRSTRVHRKAKDKLEAHYVPFIRSAKTTDSHEINEKKSTMTATEREAFARLRSLAKVAPTKPATRKGSGSPAASESKESTTNAKDNADTSPSIDSVASTSPHAPGRRVRADLALVREQLDACRTDADLWDTILGQILSRVVVLNLDPITNDQQAAAIKFCRALRNKRVKASNDDLEVLRANLPQHLNLAAQQLRYAFPASPYALALLPFLKKLGPSAFALGASTRLFNAHMTALFERHHDLAAVAATLEEMNRNVYAFDDATDELLDRIANDAIVAGNRGAPGPGVRALWQTTQTRHWLQQLWRWRQTSTAQRQEMVLRELHQQEATGRERVLDHGFD